MEQHPRLSTVIAAIEQVYHEHLRSLWPALPANVVFPVYYQRSRNGHIKVRGHWHALQWKVAAGDRAHELHVSSGILREAPASVLATLVHECAHARCFVLGIQGASREGRYHNRRFQRIAHEMGLRTTPDTRIGWRTPGLREDDGWPEKFAPALAVIEQAVGQLWQGQGVDRNPDGTAAGATDGGDGDAGANAGNDDKPNRSRLLKAVCACDPPRIIRAARTTLEAAPITCAVCSDKFAVAPATGASKA